MNYSSMLIYYHLFISDSSMLIVVNLKEHVGTTADLWHLLEAFGGGVTDILCACFMSAANANALPVLLFTSRTFHLDSSSMTQLVIYDLTTRTVRVLTCVEAQ